VALVGDFNDWNPDATLLVPAGPSAWTVTIPLRPGRYRYTFVVDGSRWVADPAGAAAPDDFGQPTSVITVIPN
jgi:1,4-alpha-glucan branching enzyme